MSLEVIPAIDVAAGRLARAAAGGAEHLDAFGGDPLAAATAFVEQGARWLHVVDLDLAISGRAENIDVLRAIAGLGMPVQASGGVTTHDVVGQLLEAGAKRVVVGSGALVDRAATERLVGTFGDVVAIGIEADGPTIRPRGGRGEALPLWDSLQWLGDLDVRRFVFTEVGRVASLGGPDLDGIWAIASHTGKPVIASGGIRGTDDLRAIAALDPAVEGAIVGRALYEGLDLADAIGAVS